MSLIETGINFTRIKKSGESVATDENLCRSSCSDSVV